MLVVYFILDSLITQIPADEESLYGNAAVHALVIIIIKISNILIPLISS